MGNGDQEIARKTSSKANCSSSFSWQTQKIITKKTSSVCKFYKSNPEALLYKPEIFCRIRSADYPKSENHSDMRSTDVPFYRT